ncbi:hypothetical protein GOODEAATRI_027150, partial [Goodea atripinnis]
GKVTAAMKGLDYTTEAPFQNQSAEKHVRTGIYRPEGATCPQTFTLEDTTTAG